MADPFSLFSPNTMGPPQRFSGIPATSAMSPPNPAITGKPQGVMDGLTAFLQQNPGAMMQLAAGLMGGRQALPQALANMPAAMKLDTEAARRKRQEAATKKWLESQKAMPPATAELLQEADPSDVMSSALKSQVVGADEYGLKEIWTQDAKGNYYPAQASKSGAPPRLMKAPTGSKFVPPGDLAGMKAAGAASGKGEGDALVKYRSMTSKLPGLQKVVAELDVLADKATYTVGGNILDTSRRQIGMEPREASVARAQYISMIDNQILPLLRDTFGAQFTEREGATLRATLGNPDMAPAEKKAVLQSFIEQKVRDIEALAQESSSGVGPASTVPAGGKRHTIQTPSGVFEMEVED